MARDIATAGSAIDEFEQAFESVCQYLQPMDDTRASLDEIKADAGHLISEFLEAGKAVERFFLQKRLLLTRARPEQVLKEECIELKQEIVKKDQLIQRHHDKVQAWKLQLRSPISAGVATTPLQQQQPGSQQQQQAAQHQPQQQTVQQMLHSPAVQPQQQPSQASQQQQQISQQQQQMSQQQQQMSQQQQQHLLQHQQFQMQQQLLHQQQSQQQQQQTASVQWAMQQPQQPQQSQAAQHAQWPSMQQQGMQSSGQQPPPYSNMGAVGPLGLQAGTYGGQGTFGQR